MIVRHWVTRICLSAGAMSLLLSSCALRSGPSRETVRAHQKAVLEDVVEEVGFVKHEQGNVTSEIRSLEGRLASQEALLDSLRRELVDAQNSMRQLVSKELAQFGSRVSEGEQLQQSLLGDVRQLKTFSNDFGESLTQAKKLINSFEATLDRQKRDVQSLEGAVRALMAIVQNDTPASVRAVGTRRYRVKPGDTLEKIARAHKSTVEELKAKNRLKSDLIVIDQELQLPE